MTEFPFPPARVVSHDPAGAFFVREKPTLSAMG